MAEPGVWAGKRMDLFFPISSGLVFCPLGKTSQFKAEGTKTQPNEFATLKSRLGHAAQGITPGKRRAKISP